MSTPFPSRRLGPYELIELIGKGGMGEVWRAHDSRLGRDVAVKLSAAQFSDRFEREARAIAALNHPNICTLFDVGPNYLVMELIDGPTLADRIAEAPIPNDEALAIAGQIAEALDAAHQKNIIHRDLKPGNIKVRPDGSVKVLDFGLARTGMAESAVTSESPTLMHSPTVVGMILGTAAYMAPEQARGKVVDQRADIWAFGVVLYEMVTGERLFEGEDLTETLASVVKSAPDMAPVPARLRRLLDACLQKDPKNRLRHIGDYRLLLEDPAPASPPASAGSEQARTWLGMAPIALVTIALGLIAFGLALVHFREKPPVTPAISATLLPPEGTDFNFDQGFGLPALSPDGTRLAFGAVARDGRKMLYTRRLDSPAAQPLQGSEDAIFPFWSPDSRWLAFEQRGVLKKIDTQGGPPVTLGNLGGGTVRGGSWGPAGIILLGTQLGAILQIPAAGGAAKAVVPSAMGGDTYPWFLPDGRHFLYTHRQPGDIPLQLASIDEPGKPGKVVAQVQSNAVYAQGHLLYLRDRTLMAQPFDATKLQTTGEAAPVAENIPTFINPSRAAGFTVSANGLLVYTSDPRAGEAHIVWKDRQGKTLGTLGDSKQQVSDLALSADGKHLAAAVLADGASSASNIWIFDTERGVPTRFTFDSGFDRSPVWSPDGKMIYFNSTRSGFQALYRRPLNGSTEDEELPQRTHSNMLTSISPDGQFLMFTHVSGAATDQILVTPAAANSPAGNAEPAVFLRTPFSEAAGAFRPDGRWVAYESDESGSRQIYIAAFPGAGRKRQVSSGGGRLPQWRRDGKELFYESATGDLMAVEVLDRGAVLEIGAIQKLFGGLPTSGRFWTASGDGRKFVVVEQHGSGAAQPLTLVQNWLAALKR